MKLRVVIDTNVLAGAVLSASGHDRNVLRACFDERVQPIVGEVLFHEYADVLGGDSMLRRSPLSATERIRFFEAFLGMCEWTQVYCLWHPNLRDEGDNRLIESAVAGGAALIITNNIRDFRGSELRFSSIRVVEPAQLGKELR